MSLYNEVRPKTLTEVQGQDNIKNQIMGLFASGRIPNAMLFTGPRGTGKTTIARIVAKMLNCENGGSEPCNQCRSCKDIANGTSMDVIEMDAASNNKVEDVRQIIEKAQYKPLGKYKVFILDEVHMFSTGAWNALLKTIEEPPKNCVFILCTTEEHKVPATIISRCMKFYFEKLELGLIADYLSQICDERGKAYDSDALKLIAQASEGCMRDALSIMESFFETDSLATECVAKTLGMSQENAVFDILTAISKGDSAAAINAVKEVSRHGRNLQLLVKSLVNAVSDTLFVLNGASIDTVVNTQAYRDRLIQYKDNIDVTRCLELAKQFSSVYASIQKTPDAEFLIQAAIFGAIECESSVDRCYRQLDEIYNLIGSGEPVQRVVVKEEIPFDTAAETIALGECMPAVEPAFDDDYEEKEHEAPFVDGNGPYVPAMDDGFEDVDTFEGIPFPTDIPSYIEDEEDVSPVCEIPSDVVTPPEAPSVQVIEQSNVKSDLPFEEDAFQIPTQQPKPVTENKTAPDPSNLLAFMPKGTKVSGIENMPTGAVNNDIVAEETQHVAGEQKPTTQPKEIKGMTPIGFDGFSGWL